MLKTLCALAYVTVFVPVWAFRRATGSSPFGRRFHRRRSTWDRPVTSARPAAAGR